MDLCLCGFRTEIPPYKTYLSIVISCFQCMVHMSSHLHLNIKVGFVALGWWFGFYFFTTYRNAAWLDLFTWCLVWNIIISVFDWLSCSLSWVIQSLTLLIAPSINVKANNWDCGSFGLKVVYHWVSLANRGFYIVNKRRKPPKSPSYLL